MYSLSGAGSLTIEADTTWVQRLLYYSISHNVSPVAKALGLGLAPLFMTEDMGILTSVQKIVMDHSAFLDPFLMLLAAAGYVWLVRKMAQNIILSTGLYSLGILTAGTDLFLWIRPFSDSAILLFALGIHVILAGVTVAALVGLTFMKRR